MAETLVVFDMLSSSVLVVKPLDMLLLSVLFQQRILRKARRSSLDEHAYMKGLMQLLKYPSQKAKLNRFSMSQVKHAASARERVERKKRAVRGNTYTGFSQISQKYIGHRKNLGTRSKLHSED
jgi:hypothetical protein